MDSYNVLIIILIAIMILLLFFRKSDQHPVMKGGGKVRILFVGTVPISIEPDASEERQLIMPNGARHDNPLYVGKNDNVYDGRSNMMKISKFLAAHEGEIEYDFLINKNKLDMHDVDLDPAYESHIIDRDLRRERPPENMYDIVYIDTNTLLFIDSSKTDPAYWIDFFRPCMKEHACMIIDDTDVFTQQYRGNGYKGYLGHDIHAGLSKKFMLAPQVRALNPILRDFIEGVSRYDSFSGLVLITIPKEAQTLSPAELVKMKMKWDL